MERFNHLKIKELKSLKSKIDSEISRLKVKKSSEEILTLSKESKNESDMGSTDYTTSQILRFQSRELFYLKKLEGALKKFDEKEYGCCEDCGVEISYTRLLARPTAGLCINCKEEAEREEKFSLPSNTTKEYNSATRV